jgi:prephenate dehydrogenase
MTYEKVTMIGAGFMSASLALELRERGLAGSTWALARSEARAAELRKLGVFDEVTADFDAGVRDADVIVLATPIGAMEHYIRLLDEYLDRFTGWAPLVTDIGSTKTEVLNWVREYGTRKLCRCFVGSHPLCGSEKQGARFAAAGLYEGAMCVIVPLDCSGQCPDISLRIAAFWQSVGCRTAIVAEDEHDRILASTSHVPHVLSFAYARSVDKRFFPYTAGSFRDLTRLSRSSPAVWTDIFSSNRERVLEALESFERSLRELKSHIANSADLEGRNALYSHLQQIVQFMEQYHGHSD